MSTALRAAVTAVFFLCADLLGGIGPAEGGQQCAPLVVFQRAISEQYQEERVAVATANGKKGEPFAMIWYQNRETGTWTQLVVNKAGIACHMASGQGGIRRLGDAAEKLESGTRSRDNSLTPAIPGKRGERGSSAPAGLPPLTDEQKRLMKRAIEGRDA